MKKLFFLVLSFLTISAFAQPVSKQEQMPITPFPDPTLWPGWNAVHPISVTTFIDENSSPQMESKGIGYLFFVPNTTTAMVYIKEQRIIANQQGQPVPAVTIRAIPMTSIGAPITGADLGTTQKIRTGQNTYVRVFVNPLTGMPEPKPVFVVRQVRYVHGDPNDASSWSEHFNYYL